MEQNGENTPPAREEDRLPPNVTRRRRRRAEPTEAERAEADALMAPIPRRPAVPYLAQLLGQRAVEGPPPNVTVRRERTNRAQPIPFVLPDTPPPAPQPADDVNELLGDFRQFMNNLEQIRLQHVNNPYERATRITGLVNNYFFRERNLILQLEITRLAQLGQTLPENYREQAINEFLAMVNNVPPGERIGVNRFIRQAQAQAQAQAPPPQPQPLPADDINELLVDFRQFMNRLQRLRIEPMEPNERPIRVRDSVNDYFFRQRNLIIELERVRLAQLGQTLPENYREQAINEFLEIFNNTEGLQIIDVNRFYQQAQALLQPQAQAQARPLQPRGVAYEIHNAFTEFQAKKNAYLALIAEPDNEYGNIINYVYENYFSIIGQLFPNDAVEKRKQLKKVIKKIMDSRFDEYKDLIGKTVSFVTKQDNDFKEQYILAFLNDTCNAYATGSDRTSCVKGIIERIILSVGSAVQILCMDHCENETYQKLNALMNPKFKAADAANSWFETAETNAEIQGMDKAGRKNNFIEYLKSEAIRLDHKDGFIPENIMADINRYAETMDYAFENLQLGGAKKSGKSIKSRRSKKTRKAKKTRKSKK
jgi:HAMP domain-containing protein